MSGQSTQTDRLPYDHFREFTAEISEDELKKMGELPKDITSLTRQFNMEISSRFDST